MSVSSAPQCCLILLVLHAGANSYHKVGDGACCTSQGQGPYAVIDQPGDLNACESRCSETVGCVAVTLKGSADPSPCHDLHFSSESACNQYCNTTQCSVNQCADEPHQVAEYTQSNCRGDPATWSCMALSAAPPPPTPEECIPAGTLDIRVSKAGGPHGYNVLRLSAISQGAVVPDKLFSYQSQFKFSWTDLSVSTGLQADLSVGTNKIQVGDVTLCVKLPDEDKGIRGILFGDPCTDCEGQPGCNQCNTVQQFNIKTRLSTLLNNVAKGPQPIDFWGVLGDNFYDYPLPHKSVEFFNQLSMEAKSVLLMTIPGNHDFWINGDDSSSYGDDQYGNGFMQFYGQDTVAGQPDPSRPFNFSSPPPNSDDCPGNTCSGTVASQSTANPDNFFFFHKIGNVGFIGFSGHTLFENQKNRFEEACKYFSEHKPTEVVLFGHWSEGGHGGEGQDTGFVQKQVRDSFPDGCGTAKAFFGHQHCNLYNGDQAAFHNGCEAEKSLAGKACFQHGATGYGGDDCGTDQNHWGVLFFDTTANGFLELWYYPLGDTAGNTAQDISHELLQCLENHGLGDQECKQYGTQWLKPMPPV